MKTVVVLVPGRWLRVLGAAGMLAALILLLTRTVPVATTPLTELLSGRTVLIDPGHGGPDPGCTRGELQEKDLVLDIAQRLADRFRQAAMRPVLTRTSDTDLGDPGLPSLLQRKRDDLRRRAELADRNQAELLLSIHANSFPSPLWSGAQVFHYPGNQAGLRLAQVLQDVLVERLGPNPRREKAGDFYLLARAKVPAAMVEVGFLSNPREAQLLREPGYRQRVADAIFEGAVRYLVERARGGNVPPSAREANGGAARQEERQRRWRAVADRNPDEVVLYFAGPTNGEDWLVPELRLVRGFAALPRTERIAVALRELARGPGPGSALLGLLPPGTRAKQVSLAPGLVTVDLTGDFARVLEGGHTEALAVYSIVNTVAELAPECRIRLTAKGEDLAVGHLELPRAFAPQPAWALPGRDGAGDSTGATDGRRVRQWVRTWWSNFSRPSSASAPSPSAAGGPWCP